MYKYLIIWFCVSMYTVVMADSPGDYNLSMLLESLNKTFLWSGNSIVIKPHRDIPKYTKEAIGIVFMHGAFYTPDRYIHLCTVIQALINKYEVWISLTQSLFSFPMSFLATRAIDSSIQALYNEGLHSQAKLFLIGHSLGGLAAFEYYMNNKDNNPSLTGVITLGCVPRRSDRHRSQNINMLILTGEVDGVARVTRTAEEFYHRNLNHHKDSLLEYRGDHTDENENTCVLKKDSMGGYVDYNPTITTTSASTIFPTATSVPVIVLEGLNHVSYLSGESKNAFVAYRDLKAEKSENEGHYMIGETIAAFIEENINFIQNKLIESYKLFKSIIQAFELEGSVHFNRPDQKKCIRGYCGLGPDWSKYAQEILSKYDLISQRKEHSSLSVSSHFVKLWSMPPYGEFYHPKLHISLIEKISGAKSHRLEMNISTYSQCSWSLLDRFDWTDGGFQFISADEIGVKMYSRQCSLMHGAHMSSDDYTIHHERNDNICAEINKNAYDRALQSLPETSRKRFLELGQPMVFGNDILVSNGFSWVFGSLIYRENDNNKSYLYTILFGNENHKQQQNQNISSNKTSVISVISKSLTTPYDAKPVPFFAPEGGECYHFCKLLSPARAVEWMLVDGLRKNDPITTVLTPGTRVIVPTFLFLFFLRSFFV